MMNILLQSFLLLSLTTAQAPTDSTSLAHEEEVRAWHERRTRNLHRDYGWLTLIALEWLRQGPNHLSGVGTLTLTNDSLFFRTEKNVNATLNDEPFSEGPLIPEGQNVRPDTVRIASRTFVVIERAGRFAVRMWDKNAKTRKEFGGIERFPIDLKWRFEARWEAYNPPKQIKVPTVIPDYEQDYPVPGVAIFTFAGKRYRLEPVLEEPDGDYFFIFGDKTNGRETYGAGRFLYAKPAKDGKVIIDFNKAYNPPCAFTEYATCPLPPPGNKLPISVEAGEKNYASH
ncbi:MAG: DUF1684 domain-containing protein [Ignavibacteriales bacterium]|nr:DUF1684 domain-containing protein [Ignavibacteriales bacterium]